MLIPHPATTPAKMSIMGKKYLLKKKNIPLLGGIAFIGALAGLLVTQYFWITNAFTLSEEQFDHRVTLALNEITTELNQDIDKYHGCTNVTCPKYDQAHTCVADVVKTDNLKKMIANHIANYDLDTLYLFTLTKAKDTTVLFSKGTISKELCLKPHKACLDWKPETYYIRLYFPEKQKFILAKLSWWIGLSVVFTIALAAIFLYIAFKTLRQKKLSEVKDDFINNITHEFKTPISTIEVASSFLTKIDQHTALDKIRTYAGIIHEENSRLKNQTNYILKIAQMERRCVDFNIKPFDLNSLIYKSVKEFVMFDRGKHIDIKLCLAPEIKEVEGDEFHLKNAISNLLDNAAKYSSEEVVIKISTQITNGKVLMAVEDNGNGISKEHQKHIFEKFYRCNTGNLHNTKGFGLGLFYVQKVVEHHHGTIQLYSQVGKGTTFSIQLPLKTA